MSTSRRPDGTDCAPSLVDAKTVVLAAGTLGSTEILLRSRERGLGLSDRLGERFSANGDIIAFALGGRERVNAVGVGEPPKFTGDTIGACVAGQIELPDDGDLDRSMIIQEGTCRPRRSRRSCRSSSSPAGAFSARRKASSRASIRGRCRACRPSSSCPMTTRRGRITFDNGSVQVDWPDVADQPVYARVDEALTKAAEAVGARYIKKPAAPTTMGTKPATAHPLGGCGMGETAASGVVNHKCQVFAGPSGRGDACRTLCLRRCRHPALHRRQPAAHHHRAGRARHGAPCPRP